MQRVDAAMDERAWLVKNKGQQRNQKIPLDADALKFSHPVSLRQLVVKALCDRNISHHAN